MFVVVGALATLPVGVLADRVRRMSLLAASVALWTIAMWATGAATSFAMLLAARLFLGAVTATAGPTVASLVGDLFPVRARGRARGIVNSGELVGSGFGFLVAAVVATWLSWRFVFWAIGAVGALLVAPTWRFPEPPRIARLPAEVPLRTAVAYALRVRTNVIVIVSSSIGYFFFAGIRTFAVVLVVHQFDLRQSAADGVLLAIGAGALLGILGGGRAGDALLARGHLNARLILSVLGYATASLFLLGALLLDSLAPALPLYVLAGAALGAPSPLLDAVRLDVIHPQLWGRAEATRNVLRIAAEAAGPVLFGLAADSLGVRTAFLLALPSLAASALILATAFRYYARDVDTIAAGSRHVYAPAAEGHAA